MTTIYLNSGGGAPVSPYANWTNAAATLTQALAVATGSGDIIKMHKTHAESNGVDTTYTFLNNVAVICVDKDNSDALAVQTTAYGIGDGGTNNSLVFAGAYRVYMYGVYLYVSGSGAEILAFNQTANALTILEQCTLSVAGPAPLAFGNNNDSPCAAEMVNCVVTLGDSGSSITTTGKLRMVGGSVAIPGTQPPLIDFSTVWDASGPSAEFIGVDLSALDTLVGNSTPVCGIARFDRCKLKSGFAAMAAQTHTNRTGPEAYIHDCSAGDVHGVFGYYNTQGSVVTDSTIKLTAGAAGQSWKITTTAYCSYYAPFVTPPIALYNSTLSALTPYVEILRNGSASAYKDNEVWARFDAKVTTGYTLATPEYTRQGLAAYMAGTAGSDIATGTGLSNWDGEGGTAWSGKLVSAGFTPAENGAITASICVGKASVTDLYGDPQIRT